MAEPRQVRPPIRQRMVRTVTRFFVTVLIGVGATLAYTLLALLPEFGQISRKQMAALVGLAPYAFDSDRFRGQRHIYGGRIEHREHCS